MLLDLLNKKCTVHSEELYRKIEFLCGYLKLIGKDDCYKDIEKYYELLLCQQFHDVLPGSANAEVYKDTASDFESIISSGENILKLLHIICQN